MSEETGWLIEFQIGGHAVWWRGRAECGRIWTTDANEAVRFARKCDGETVLAGLVLRDPMYPAGAKASVTDHMWVASRGEEEVG